MGAGNLLSRGGWGQVLHHPQSGIPAAGPIRPSPGVGRAGQGNEGANRGARREPGSPPCQNGSQARSHAQAARVAYTTSRWS